MAYKSLLVHVDSSPRAGARIKLALELAQTFDAHLTGIFVSPTPLDDMGMAIMPYQYAPGLPMKLIEESAARARDTFEKAVSPTGFERYEWRQYIGAPLEDLALSARYHDLLIMGQGDPAQSLDGLPVDLVQTMVMGAGRPVLIVPHSGDFSAIGRRVLVGWNASQEATRAVTDALPLLARAAHVRVLAINSRYEGHHGEVPGADIATYLARHAVDVETMSDSGASIDSGDLILSNAADIGADLIVMGAYGHSRLREIVLGGATHTVFESMTVPVLMSH